MGNALVIKNTNFSTNKLTTVTLLDRVPCTGISLNRNTITVTNLEDSVTLIATLTPSNTTDVVTWSSSNTSVATVENGIVTVHGIGTATITATCGSRTATATVQQTSVRIPAVVMQGVYPSDAGNGNNATLLYGNAAQASCGQAFNASHSAGQHMYYSVGNPSIEIAKAPYGATKTKLHASDDNTIYGRVILVDCENLSSYRGVDCATYISETTAYLTNNAVIAYGQGVVYRADSTSNIVNADYIEFS